MAGKNYKGEFSEKISPFLLKKMEEIRKSKGENSEDYRALFLQYKLQDFEKNQTAEINERHWDAEMSVMNLEFGFERLYSRTAVFEPTMICAAHCRYCLRANYNIFTLTEDQIVSIAKYFGTKNSSEINEVLITGGDPLIVPKKLDFLVESLIEHAPNIEIMRIATRLPIHDPERVDNSVFELFSKHRDKILFELATQINHPVDLFPETTEVYQKFRKLGITIYAQNVLIKGVNDNIETLVRLYNKLREIGIESHYLFHSVPMRGTHHYRTSVERGLQLINELNNSGRISGRAKPAFALMTDIGKITLYEGTILEKDMENNKVLIQSFYKMDERLKNNPHWKLPENSYVDETGYLRIWYLDGKD
jgi:lysine 2,3-aminomutase